MRKTGFLKRMISMICIISIMTISFVQPSFAANTAPTITSNDGYTYEMDIPTKLSGRTIPILS